MASLVYNTAKLIIFQKNIFKQYAVTKYMYNPGIKNAKCVF